MSTELQKTSSNATTSNNPSPVVSSTPQVSPSFLITPGNSNSSQVNSSIQANSENTNQFVLPYDSNIKGRLITDPEVFYEKLELLFKKKVKDQFETQQEFEERFKQDVKNFKERESFNFKDNFILRTRLNLTQDNYSYNAETQTLVIKTGQLSFPNNEHKTLANVSVDRQNYRNTEFYFSLLSPESKSISNDDVTNYWLDKKRKIEIYGDTTELTISNLEPGYAKQLVKGQGISLEANFTMPVIVEEHHGVYGFLLGLKVIDNQTNKALWSLN